MLLKINSVMLGHVMEGRKGSVCTTAAANPFSLVNLYLHKDNVKFRVPEEVLVLGDPIDPELGIQPFKAGIDQRVLYSQSCNTDVSR